MWICEAFENIYFIMYHFFYDNKQQVLQYKLISDISRAQNSTTTDKGNGVSLI